MEKHEFVSIIKEILKKEDIIDYDKALFEKFLNDTKKNTLVTRVTKSDGRKSFFKAIKPWAIHWSFLEYQKGALVYELLERAGVSSFPKVFKKGKYKGVFYYIEGVIPIEDTLGDKEIMPLNKQDGIRILDEYKKAKKQADVYLREGFEYKEAVSLMPYSNLSHSNYSQNYSFWGQIILFEEQLMRLGYLNKPIAKDFILKYLKKNRKEIYARDTLQLLHGDLAPHNIIYGKKIYFVDWERAIITQIPFIGDDYDISNLYVYTHRNPDFQKAFYNDTLSFKVCLAFHCLYKATYVIAFEKKEEQELLSWCINTLKSLKLKG